MPRRGEATRSARRAGWPIRPAPAPPTARVDGRRRFCSARAIGEAAEHVHADFRADDPAAGAIGEVLAVPLVPALPAHLRQKRPPRPGVLHLREPFLQFGLVGLGPPLQRGGFQRGERVGAGRHWRWHLGRVLAVERLAHGAVERRERDAALRIGVDPARPHLRQVDVECEHVGVGHQPGVAAIARASHVLFGRVHSRLRGTDARPPR